MKISIKPTDLGRLESDAIICFAFKNNLEEIRNSFPSLAKILQEAIEKEDFAGNYADSLIIHTKGLINSYKLILIGLGEKNDFDIYLLQKAVAQGVKQVLDNKLVNFAVDIPDYWLEKYQTYQAVKLTAEAIHLSSYKFSKYKGAEELKKYRDLDEAIIRIPATKLQGADTALRIAEIFSLAVRQARDLVNEPSYVATPKFLAQTALDISKKHKNAVKVKIFEEKEVIKMGMGAYYGVAKGSAESLKFIHLSYKPPKVKKKIVLVGKGITFDTGGLSLKGAEHMETMKLDMAGAACVLAVFSALPMLDLQVEVCGLIAACENMPSGRALKPGDILKAYNGKTIEVLNTDAEGRLTLADMLSYAVLEEKPAEIIDLATLTGACMVALGQDIAGLWGNNEKMLAEIETSTFEAGEKVWRMPLEKDYRELLKSSMADLKNISGGKYGGAITAALFLEEFVGKIPWVHLDIAGPAFAEKDTPLTPRGATGYGVRLLLRYLISR